MPKTKTSIYNGYDCPIPKGRYNESERTHELVICLARNRPGPELRAALNRFNLICALMGWPQQDLPPPPEGLPDRQLC